jgi:hypothetical protein
MAIVVGLNSLEPGTGLGLAIPRHDEPRFPRRRERVAPTRVPVVAVLGRGCEGTRLDLRYMGCAVAERASEQGKRWPLACARFGMILRRDTHVVAPGVPPGPRSTDWVGSLESFRARTSTPSSSARLGLSVGADPCRGELALRGAATRGSFGGSECPFAPPRPIFCHERYTDGRLERACRARPLAGCASYPVLRCTDPV